jgi:hypothetical protein
MSFQIRTLACTDHLNICIICRELSFSSMKWCWTVTNHSAVFVVRHIESTERYRSICPFTLFVVNLLASCQQNDKLATCEPSEMTGFLIMAETYVVCTTTYIVHLPILWAFFFDSSSSCVICLLRIHCRTQFRERSKGHNLQTCILPY